MPRYPVDVVLCFGSGLRLTLASVIRPLTTVMYFVGQNIRQISDILSFTAEQNIERIATFLDFEKAFDSLEWEFLSKAMETFNFGSDFKRWIQVLYNNISSCTVNNGFSSPFFNLHRGVRKGCPLSGMLLH